MSLLARFKKQPEEATPAGAPAADAASTHRGSDLAAQEKKALAEGDVEKSPDPYTEAKLVRVDSSNSSNKIEYKVSTGAVRWRSGSAECRFELPRVHSWSWWRSEKKAVLIERF